MEMYQMVVAVIWLHYWQYASVLEFWNSRQTMPISPLVLYLAARTAETLSIKKHLSCALSRLSSSEPDTILRVSGCYRTARCAYAV